MATLSEEVRKLRWLVSMISKQVQMNQGCISVYSEESVISDDSIIDYQSIDITLTREEENHLCFAVILPNLFKMGIESHPLRQYLGLQQNLNTIVRFLVNLEQNKQMKKKLVGDYNSSLNTIQQQLRSELIDNVDVAIFQSIISSLPQYGKDFKPRDSKKIELVERPRMLELSESEIELFGFAQSNFEEAIASSTKIETVTPEMCKISKVPRTPGTVQQDGVYVLQIQIGDTKYPSNSHKIIHWLVDRNKYTERDFQNTMNGPYYPGYFCVFKKLIRYHFLVERRISELLATK